jgi:Leucine-rich repeat (LRR) protein
MEINKMGITSFKEAELRIDIAFKEMAESLSLKDMGLKYLPESLSRLTKLKHLDIMFNDLTELGSHQHSWWFIELNYQSSLEI